tara:strand:+ start:43 stop:369 length:327 start_codon:yes stop_codon:yes gene_type:complete
MARRKKVAKTTLPPNTGTLDAVINNTAELFTNVSEDASYRITKSVIQNKMEADADWKDGINQFRERAMKDIARIDSIEGYVRRNIELLVKKVLALEKKVEHLSSRRTL